MRRALGEKGHNIKRARGNCPREERIINFPWGKLTSKRLEKKACFCVYSVYSALNSALKVFRAFPIPSSLYFRDRYMLHIRFVLKNVSDQQLF